MTAVFPPPARGRRASRRFLAVMTAHPLAIAFALTAIVTAIRLTGTVDSDVASQLWIADRIRSGADLYRDIIEVNPPLWFWMALPFGPVAEFLHVEEGSVLIAVFGLLVAASVAATDRLITQTGRSRRTFLLCYTVLILAAMPWLHVGQREQIVLIGTLPYAALIAARREGRSVSPLLAVAVGAGAALGFALKHYFLIVPALLELWFAAGLGRRWKAIRPETAAVAAIGFAYGAALLVEHDYLARMVPLVRLAYSHFGPRTLQSLLGPYAIVSLATLAFVAAHARLLAGRRAPLSSALLIAGLGFAATYFIQFKGWPYHAIPMLGCGALALAALLAEAGASTPLLRTVGPALLTMPLLVSAEEAAHQGPANRDALAAVRGLRSGDFVGFLTTETSISSSISLRYGFRNPSRYNGIWMLQAVIDNELRGNPDPRIAALGRKVISDTVADYRCNPPKRIIAARPRPGERGFDIVAFFSRDPQFRELLSHYRVRSRTSIETLEMVRPWPPEPAPHCLRET